MAGEPIKRLKYFTGQFLEALDFKAEQDYHVGMRRRGNQSLYRCGILDNGFQVSAVTGDTSKITISPGIGVDGQGREVVVASPLTASLPPGGASSQAYFVTLQYAEAEVDQQTPDADVSDNTRIEESVTAQFVVNESSIDRSIAFPVAKLTVATNGRLSGTIDPSVRQYAEARFQGLTVSCDPGADNRSSLSKLGLTNRGAGGTPVTWNLYTAAVGGGWGVTPNAFEIWSYEPPTKQFELRRDGTTLLAPSGGNVGVGTTAPGSALHVNVKSAATPISAMTVDVQSFSTPTNAAASHFVRFRDLGAGNFTHFLVRGDGNVGIGNGTPGAKLHVAGNGGVLNLEGRDHAYIQWYPKGAGAGRKAWIGYGNASTDLLTIQNDAGRVNIHGTESLYLLNLQGVTVSKGGGGNGKLTVEGEFLATSKLQVTGGAIVPAAGNSESAGILFPKDAFGGSGDAASIRYYARSGEATTLELRTANDADDHIALIPAGGVGIGTTTPTAKLQVVGDARVDGNLALNGRLDKLDVAQGSTFGYVRVHDLCIGHSSRHPGTTEWTGRALVDYGNTLIINYDSDWPNVVISGKVSHPSSRALKNDIRALPGAVAADIITSMEPVTFHFKSDPGKTECLGFIAEDVPPAVATDSRDGILPNHIIAALVRVVKDQQKAISSLEARLSQLEAAVKHQASFPLNG